MIRSYSPADRTWATSMPLEHDIDAADSSVRGAVQQGLSREMDFANSQASAVHL